MNPRAGLLAVLLLPIAAWGAPPREIARAFAERGIAMPGVAIVVQESGATAPLFTHQPEVAMNPASVMKLVTTFAALDLLGADYRWRTDAYLDGPLSEGRLDGDLVLAGSGDPKITLEQWDAFVASMRDAGLAEITGDLVLDRSLFRLPPHDPAAFDGEPLLPYNVGPDALLVNFKAVRFHFEPDIEGASVGVTAEPPMPQIAIGQTPSAVGGPCGNWRESVQAAWILQPGAVAASFPGRYPRECGARDWYVAPLDHPNYVHGAFRAAFGATGGRFGGAVREGHPPPGAAPIATLLSPPLHEIVRDINKLSNNVMAQQVFLTLAAATMPPPATFEKAREAVRRWLAKRRLALRSLVIENGSGLSRSGRLSAGDLARLLDAADASPARDAFAGSLAVAAIDGTVQRRFQNGPVAGQALLKTGTLEGVRAIAGYVIDRGGRRWIVAAIVNHPNAYRAQGALDALVQWTWRHAATYRRPPIR